MKEKAKQITGNSGGGLVLMDKKGKGKKMRKSCKSWTIYYIRVTTKPIQLSGWTGTNYLSWIARCQKLSLDRRLFITFMSDVFPLCHWGYDNLKRHKKVTVRKHLSVHPQIDLSVLHFVWLMSYSSPKIWVRWQLLISIFPSEAKTEVKLVVASKNCKSA